MNIVRSNAVRLLPKFQILRIFSADTAKRLADPSVTIAANALEIMRKCRTSYNYMHIRPLHNSAAREHFRSDSVTRVETAHEISQHQRTSRYIRAFSKLPFSTLNENATKMPPEAPSFESCSASTGGGARTLVLETYKGRAIARNEAACDRFQSLDRKRERG